MHLGSIDAIRERNKELIKISGTLTKHLPKISPVHDNGGENATTPQKQAAMTDVLVAALKAGLTILVTYTIDDLGTPITGLPAMKRIALASIRWVTTKPLAALCLRGRRASKSRISHMNQVKTIVEQLKQTPKATARCLTTR